MKEINVWWAQHELSTGLLASEYLLMDLLRKQVQAQCLGSYSSVIADIDIDALWGTKLFPL